MGTHDVDICRRDSRHNAEQRRRGWIEDRDSGLGLG
jgi:hypothetical protein